MPITKEDLRHINRIKEDRKSKAPYNFVPLPVKIWTWEGYEPESNKTRPWMCNDSYSDDLLTGEITVTAEFKTPFFIGSGKEEIIEIEKFGKKRKKRLKRLLYLIINLAFLALVLGE